MKQPLIARNSPFWAKTVGVLILIFVVPILVAIKLVMIPFERPMKRSSEEVARYLRDFLEETGGKWDWDDFISIEIADPRLEDLRARASMLDLPMIDTDTGPLLALIAEAEAIATSDQAESAYTAAAS